MYVIISYMPEAPRVLHFSAFITYIYVYKQYVQSVIVSVNEETTYMYAYFIYVHIQKTRPWKELDHK